MSSCFLQNPYNPDGGDWADHQKICARVSPSDVAFLRRLLPFRYGCIDKIVSTLFHHFIHELRKLESANGEPFDPAYFPEHPTELVLAQLIERISRLEGGAVGRPAGTPGQDPSPRDDAGAASSVHPTVQRSAPVRSNTEAGSD